LAFVTAVTLRGDTYSRRYGFESRLFWLHFYCFPQLLHILPNCPVIFTQRCITQHKEKTPRSFPWDTDCKPLAYATNLDLSSHSQYENWTARVSS